MMMSPLTLLACALCVVASDDGQESTDENAADEWLDDYNTRAQEVYNRYGLASWEFATNITDYNKQKQLRNVNMADMISGVQMNVFPGKIAVRLITRERFTFTCFTADVIDASLVRGAFDNEAAKNASMFDWSAFTDTSIKRQLSKISQVGTSKLAEVDQTKYELLQKLLSDMGMIYSVGKVKDENGKMNSLEPDLTRTLADPKTSYDKLLWAWKGWRDVTGPAIRPKYKQFVELSNEAAKLNNYKDTGEYWRSSYALPDYDFQADVLRLYNQLSPLYEQLHAYIRRKLKEKYGDDKFPKSGHIPAHLLGNMWAQTWSNLQSFVQPYPGKESVDITPTLVERNYDAKKLFQLSEDFFISLGLSPMPEAFWNNSMIVKPTNREVVCHASAWDFGNGKDFRIKQCTDVTMEDLVTVHHEMGHIEYFLQYKTQPFTFRDSANPAFHEAVGDVIALSVATPKHLKAIGLLDKVENDRESDLNFLLSMALDKIAFLPFGYLMDQWRWSVFSGETPNTKYNEKWWDLRCKYQGVSSPIERTENDFDPGAKYHISDNTPYIRYFVRNVLIFQFHRALCNAAGQTEVLHKCDIFNSHEAGKLLGDMLKLGSSEDWPVALEKLTGSRTLDATALVDYFQPLTDWLKEQNKGEDIGWEDTCPPLVSSATTTSFWLLSVTSLVALCAMAL